jgi:flagellar motor switch protein FliM
VPVLSITDSAPQRIELGLPAGAPSSASDPLKDSSNPLVRTLTGIHEEYGRTLGTTLSAFLRSDLQVELKEITSASALSYLSSLASPTCLMVFRLSPGSEIMYLHLDAPTVFRLLELLLGGGTEGTPMVPRNLTEIEWSLLEEVVRVMVRPLGHAWISFGAVEFDVESLVSEPSLLPPPEDAPPLVRMVFDFRIAGQAGLLEIVAPTGFFGEVAPPEKNRRATDKANGPAAQALELQHRQEVEHRIGQLQDAELELEVRLEGPTASFRDLLTLQPGHVLTFAYPLDSPLSGYLNGESSLAGRIVNNGSKRAFHVAQLPAA